jgi:hypothetical protein
LICLKARTAAPPNWRYYVGQSSTIVHPTDFSDASAVAFVHALRIALATRALLYLVHVAESESSDRYGGFPINGKTPAERVAVRQERAKPLVDELKVWMRKQRDRLAPSHDLAKAINYILSRWIAFTRFLDNGRICLSNNAAERSVRCVAVGRKNWTFVGSDAGGHRAAAAYTLIETCLCRARHNQVYAECRTMPNSSRSRRSLGASCECHSA